MEGNVLTVERFIPAPAAAIFDLLADPNRHQEIDGSGSVRDARGSEPGRRLAKGDSFGMSMKIGLPYSMNNTVVEFEEDRRIAWQTKGPGPFGFIGGRIWRYELEPAEGGTTVRESWDISQEGSLSRAATRRMAKMTEANMTKTLERIEQVVTSA